MDIKHGLHYRNEIAVTICMKTVSMQGACPKEKNISGESYFTSTRDFHISHLIGHIFARSCFFFFFFNINSL